MPAFFVYLFLCSTLVVAETEAQVYTLSVACTTPSSTSLHLPNLQVLGISSNNLTLGNIPHFKFFNVSNMQQQKWIIAGAAILILISCCCYGAFVILRLRRRLRRGFTGEKKQGPKVISVANSDSFGEPKLAMFGNNFSYAQVLDATNHWDEEVVFSRGRYGTVYKASFSDGTTLAILPLLDTSTEAEGVFRKEVEVLSKVKHRNLAVLRGYYDGPPPDHVRLLVYDYMPHGDLADLLEAADHVLDWPMRHLIALGVARGLSFLHALAIVHGDVTPRNVLFDADFDAHLANFGLDKLGSPANTSVGYVSPEVARSGRATKKGDVYSFGVLLLELLIGKRRAVFSNEEEGIGDWMKRMVESGQVSELLAPGLLRLDPESTEWEEFLLGVKMALLCTLPDPDDRPSMSDVVSMLESPPGITLLPTPPCRSEQSSAVGRRRCCRRRMVGVWTTSTYQSIGKFLKKQVSRLKKKKKKSFP